MELPKPEQQHQWLHKLVGDWTYESSCPGGPGEPETKFTGTERVRKLGELWVLCEGHAEMPGGGAGDMLMTLGYDPQKSRFVGTWVGTMMTNLWVYDGELDAAQRVLTLNSDGPDFSNPGKMAKYQDIIEFINDDYRTLTTRTPDPDGNWQEFMKAHYRRKR